ncbi:hypothetical protein K440DRAFT_625880, partial [Wilcoxina mikolae CBS 423.85]
MPSTYHITNGRITPDSGTGSDSNEEEGMFDVFALCAAKILTNVRMRRDVGVTTSTRLQLLNRTSSFLHTSTLVSIYIHTTQSRT